MTQRVSLSDFQLWSSDPVTKAFKLAIAERISEAKEVLSTSAGLNTGEDNYLRGFIQAYREALEFRIEDLDD